MTDKPEEINGRAVYVPNPNVANTKIYFPVIDNGQGDVKVGFMLCCIAAFQGYDVLVHSYSDSLVTRARNRAAATFLRGDREYILFIDSDILFTKEHMDMLMQSDDPVVAGIYCKKEKEVAPCLIVLDQHKPLPVGSWAEIARAGTGFLRVHRSVFESMKAQNGDAENDWRKAALYTNHGQDEWDFFPVGVKNKEYLSEDWFFCDRARNLGFKIILDTRIQTRHVGWAVYPTDEAADRQKERELKMRDQENQKLNDTSNNTGDKLNAEPTLLAS